MKFSIALLQILPEGDNQAKNLEKGIEYCRKAEDAGADLALFPELWNIGFTPCPFDAQGRKRWEESAIDKQSIFFSEFAKLAKELEINIALTYLEKHDPKPMNSVSILDRKGNIALHYSKVFICDFGQEELLRENPNREEVGCDYNCDHGDTFDVCTLLGDEGSVKVGAMICADREFPEPATQLMLNGAELIIVPNACRWDGIRTALLKARAFENLVGVAVANYPAPKENGNSMAYDCVVCGEHGERDTLVVKAGEDEGIVMATFDLDKIHEFRKVETWRLDRRRKWYSAEKRF